MSRCFCFQAAQRRAKLTFNSLLYDQLAGAAWTEQLILRKQDIAKLLTFTKAPRIVAVISDSVVEAFGEDDIKLFEMRHSTFNLEKQ